MRPRKVPSPAGLDSKELLYGSQAAEAASPARQSSRFTRRRPEVRVLRSTTKLDLQNTSPQIQSRQARVEVTAMAARTSKKSTKMAEKAVVDQTGAKPVLLSGGNPQIAKADGDAPVQDYIAAMPGWKSDVGRRLDNLIVRNVPNVRKAVRWNSPFYGIEGQGWFLSYHVFTRYVKVTFFQGALLQPVPPGAGKDKDSRWIDIYEDKLDEEQLAVWIRQAAAIPGWRGF